MLAKSDLRSFDECQMLPVIGRSYEHSITVKVLKIKVKFVESDAVPSALATQNSSSMFSYILT